MKTIVILGLVMGKTHSELRKGYMTVIRKNYLEGVQVAFRYYRDKDGK